MRKTILFLLFAAISAFFCACGNPKADLTDESIDVTEETAEKPEESENPAIREFVSLLNEINENLQAESKENDAVSVRTAAHLMNWGVGTPLTTEQIEETAASWLYNMNSNEQSEFLQKFACVYEVCKKLLEPNAEELLKSAECTDAAYPWSDTPLETIEAIADVLKHSESQQ